MPAPTWWWRPTRWPPRPAATCCKRRRQRGRRRGGGADGAGPGRAAVAASAAAPSCCTTTRQTQDVDGLRRPRDRARRGDRELPALDRRRQRSSHAAAERARQRPLDRHAGRPAHAGTGAQGRTAGCRGRTCSSRHRAWRPTAFRSAAALAAPIDGSRTSLQRDAEAAAYFLQRRRHAEGARHAAQDPGLRRHASRHRRRRRRRALHRPDRAGHRRQDQARAAQPARDHARARPRWPTWPATRPSSASRSAPPTAPTGSAACRRRRRAASRSRSALGILENFDLGAATRRRRSTSKAASRPCWACTWSAEAERLAYADRDKYIADTDFVPLPGGSLDTMLNKPYLRSRAGADQLRRAAWARRSRATSARSPLGVGQHAPRAAPRT